MALTKVSRGLLSTSIVDNGNATAITIDSSEQVGIGTSSPYGALTVDTTNGILNIANGNTSGGTKIQAWAATPSNGYLAIEGYDKEYARIDASGNLLVGKTSIANSLGWGEVVQVGGANPAISLDNSSSVQWDISNYGGTFTIWNDANERMRIDSNGNLLVGKTATAVSSEGIEVRNNGLLVATRDSNKAAILNRKTTDGDILEFYKDSVTVGSIGTANSGDLYIGNDDTTLLFAGGSDAILPRGTAGATRDAAIDLGLSAHRFKDLHMSGIGFFGLYGSGVNNGNVAVGEGIYVGAISSANQLRSSSEGGSSTTLYIGNAAIQVSSDQRLKTNIVDTEMDALEKVNQVRVVDFNWDDPSDTSFNNRNARGKWTGVLAQELVDVLPFAVNAPRNESDLSIDTDSEQRWLVDQAQMVPVLIKAIQEQQETITALTARIEQLENT